MTVERGPERRVALRDFQRRLADRLKSAADEGVHAVWLAVEARSGRYLIPLAQAGEIFPAVSAHPVPHTQRWFLGVVSLRGGLYGVADLAALLDVPAEGLLPPRPAGAEAQLVTLNATLDVQCALRVDRLAGLRGPEAFTGSTPPAASAPEWFRSTHHEPSGTAWQALDLQVLSQQPFFLRLGA